MPMTLPSTPRRARGLRLTLAILAAAVLAACGGSGDKVSNFSPRRLIVFGDETSLIVKNGNTPGRKHSINDSADDGGESCLELPIWVQRLGFEYDIGFPECPLSTNDEASPRGLMRAALNARVDDVGTAVNAFLATGVRTGDLATVYVGLHDIFALADGVTAAAQIPAAQVAAAAAGERLAGHINRLATSGVRVLFGPLPNPAFTPAGRAQTGSIGSTSRGDLLDDLSERFNEALRTRIINDGTLIGFVEIGGNIELSASPNNGRFDERNLAACTVADLLQCTETTLVSGADTTSHLWAGPKQIGPEMHRLIGDLAINRVRRNPF